MLVTRNLRNIFLGAFFSFAVVFAYTAAVRADYNPPGQAPPGGNVDAPLYSVGSGQTLTGTLTVTASSGTALQGSGGSIGLQGGGTTTGLYGTVSGTALNGIFGEVQTGGSGGARGVYGLAVDADDYAGYMSGGLGLGFASGDIWFLTQDAGIAWPRESDSAALYGVYVNSSGELQLRGHGGGINFMNQTPASVASISETGNLTVTGDVYVSNNKSIRVDNASTNTTVLLGNYGDGGGFSYGTNYTASLAIEGNVKASGVCIQEDCRTSWAAIEGNLWSQVGSNLYPNAPSANVAIGSTNPGVYKLHVTGDMFVTGDISAGGADVAEEFHTPPDIMPGTVMVMGNSGYKSAQPSTQAADRLVVGVVSEDAAVVIGKVEGPNKSVIALVGVVPVKVTNEGGPIHRGDLLVTSSRAGYAMREANPAIGTVIGKALEGFDGQQGMIQVLVNLQ